MNSVKEEVAKIKFHKDTKLHFKLKNGEYREVFASENLIYSFDILPHLIKDHCHLKDLDGSVCRDIPRSWLEIVVQDIY